jgi:response regulator RpfG family c-di-GMP phosphodiesterase
LFGKFSLFLQKFIGNEKQIKIKVLLVDDDPDIREFMSYNLKKENYIVETAKNGEIALEKAN